MSNSEQLTKRMLIDAKSSTTTNDSAKFYNLMWLSKACIIESCTKTLNFQITYASCAKRVELKWKAERFLREVTNEAGRTR